MGKGRERAVDGVTEDGKRGKGEKKEEREERIERARGKGQSFF